MTNKNLNFKVESELLTQAYQGNANALLEIAKQAQREKRLGLAQNFLRLAKEHGNQHAASLLKHVS